MSFPPPPQDPHGSGAAGSGGGFGPPQGFGPPEQPGPPQGYGQPGQPGGYGQPPGGPGGSGGGFGQPPGGPGQPPYGGMPQQPPGGGNNGAKVAAIVVGAVLVLGLAVGGVILMGGDDGEDKASDSKSSDTSSASADPTEGETEDTEIPDPSGTEREQESETPTDEPTPEVSSSDLVPFVVLDPGQCFDHPSLSSDVSVVTKRSCDGPHNGEVIANDKLTGNFSTDKDLQAKVLELCKADASERLKSIPQDGRNYYFYAIYPSLDTYKDRGQDTISCSLTLSNSLDGTKLTKPLPS
ncbi:hypothetical protein LHJ74_31390 [Streptomyces sp. N2-109]|uniref:Septum formation-related domain-containing protein n=1 Tax=Streptomyces gossypii TaxID=2883101 RepID=A0ABT2K2G6_9ACTN|nr:hypothetical protein [Streptomyces gossypii]MCT2594360.1 hypothetical protein [Streptomyces gossypii]